MSATMSASLTLFDTTAPVHKSGAVLRVDRVRTQLKRHGYTTAEVADATGDLRQSAKLMAGRWGGHTEGFLADAEDLVPVNLRHVMLPVQPLVDVVVRHTSPFSPDELGIANVLGGMSRAFYRARAHGKVSVLTADRILCHLGENLELTYAGLA